MSGDTIKNHAAFIWSIADLLRGTFKQNDYGDVILPLVVMRRLDCVLEPTHQKVLDAHSEYGATITNISPILEQASGHQFYNTSQMTFTKLLDDPANMADNLRAYIAGFSDNARAIVERFEFHPLIAKLHKANLLYNVVAKFTEIDLHPGRVSNLEMGYLYEELIRRFSELSNETAGEHFTPREVIKLMVDLLFVEDDELLAKPGVIKTILDPACGTGGMLSTAQEHLRSLNPDARLEAFGQELNSESWAVCCSDLLLKGQDPSNVAFGNSFSEDGHSGKTFDYLLANPPFGVEWKSVKDELHAEHETQGFSGRFGAGLPRISDGSLLFLQHMIAKMKPASQGGSRTAIVFNGSPMFSGAAGSGESEIRRWIIENDWLEAVVALPDQLFYNTGINIYFWIVTNRKTPKRQGKVQLIDARESFTKMRKSLGDKRKYLDDDQIVDIVRLYNAFEENDRSKIFTNQSFGAMRITVDRPLRVHWEITNEALAKLAKTKPWKTFNEETGFTPEEIYGPEGKLSHWGQTWATADNMSTALAANMGGGVPMPVIKALVKVATVSDPEAPIITKKGGNSEADADLRDNENVPLPNQPVVFDEDSTERLNDETHRTAIDEYVTAEVLPYVPEAWVDFTKTKLGYEIPLTRHFYTYTPPRPLAEIDAEIEALEQEIQALLQEDAR